jgi:hypothetical protein
MLIRRYRTRSSQPGGGGGGVGGLRHPVCANPTPGAEKYEKLADAEGELPLTPGPKSAG